MEYFGTVPLSPLSVLVQHWNLVANGDSCSKLGPAFRGGIEAVCRTLQLDSGQEGTMGCDLDSSIVIHGIHWIIMCPMKVAVWGTTIFAATDLGNVL